MKHRLALIVSCAVLLASVAHAQSVPLSVGGLQLTASTNNPAPGDSVIVTAKSYTDDLSSSNLTWTVNGVVAEKGVGATSLTVTAPALGKHLTVSVSAITSSNTGLGDSIVVGSGAVDLILESSGYVPPFFSGKVDPAYQNDVTVVAIPHLMSSSGGEYDPSGLVYQWKKNGSVLQSQSGYGKQSIVMAGDILPRPYTMSVTATSRDGSAQAEGYISVTPDLPSISFYANDPLYGPLYNRALGSNVVIGSEKEAGVIAVPYGFDRAGGLSFSWSINGVTDPSLSSNDSITLRAPEGQTGSSNIALTISSAQKILQGVENEFSANFMAKPSSQTAGSQASF